MKKTIDPRELLAQKLNKIGIDAQESMIIALDAGMNAVNRTYLKEMGLTDKQLENANKLVQEFYQSETNI